MLKKAGVQCSERAVICCSPQSALWSCSSLSVQATSNNLTRTRRCVSLLCQPLMQDGTFSVLCSGKTRSLSVCQFELLESSLLVTSAAYSLLPPYLSDRTSTELLSPCAMMTLYRCWHCTCLCALKFHRKISDLSISACTGCGGLKVETADLESVVSICMLWEWATLSTDTTACCCARSHWTVAHVLRLAAQILSQHA